MPSTSAISREVMPAKNRSSTYPALAWFDSRQLRQRFVHRDDIFQMFGWQGLVSRTLDRGVVEGDVQHSLSAFAGTIATGVVDQQPPHQRRRHAEEVGAVLPRRSLR